MFMRDAVLIHTTNIEHPVSGKRRVTTKSRVLFGVLLVIITVIWFYPFRLGAIGFDDIGNTLGLLDSHMSVIHRTLLDTSANRWRPVYETLAFIEANIFGKHYEYYFWFNVAMLFVISFLVFRILARVASNTLIGFALAVIFLTSRDTYYLVTQTLGLLELLGLLFLTLMVSALIEFERSGRSVYLGLTTLFYALDIHTHERFATMIIVIIPLILTSKFLGSRSKVLWTGTVALPLIFNLCMKKYFFHMPLLVGTGSAYTLGFTWKTVFQLSFRTSGE